MRRKRLRHETDLHVRFDAAFNIGVENLVVDRPVVNRLAVRVFLVGAGRTPLQRIRAVAAGEQMMRAEINLRPAELAEFGQQFFPVLHVGVIRLIRAEKTPDRRQFANRLGRVHCDGDGKRSVRRGRVGGGFGKRGGHEVSPRTDRQLGDDA